MLRQVKGAERVLLAKGRACVKAVSEGSHLKAMRTWRTGQVVFQEALVDWGLGQRARLSVGHQLGGYLSGLGRRQKQMDQDGDLRSKPMALRCV